MTRLRSGFEQLFGSRVRARLLRLFFENPNEKFYVRELERKIGAHINAIRRELQNLLTLDIVRVYEDHEKEGGNKNKRYFGVNHPSVLFQELQNLFLKFHIFLEQSFARKAMEMGSISYLALMGSFMGIPDFPIDIFIVGNIDRTVCKKLVRAFEKEVGHPLNYTLMSEQEYMERKRLTDRFLYTIFEQNKITLIDNLVNS